MSQERCTFNGEEYFLESYTDHPSPEALKYIGIPQTLYKWSNGEQNYIAVLNFKTGRIRTPMEAIADYQKIKDLGQPKPVDVPDQVDVNQTWSK